MITVVHAHPYLSRSRANRALADAVRGVAGVDFRALYELYPDFDVDVAAEQEALARASLVVWMHPMYWYSVPALLKHWFDKVLAAGWAYGAGGTALHGKRCLWVVTTGGDDDAYTPDGMHEHPFSSFVPAIEQTARFCGMRWERPVVIHGAHSIDADELASHAASLARRLAASRDAVARPMARIAT